MKKSNSRYLRKYGKGIYKMKDFLLFRMFASLKPLRTCNLTQDLHLTHNKG